MNFDHSILTIILFIPLAGAILLALLPDRGKLMQGTALAVTLITFLATLHLPAHFNYGAPGGTFQFEQNLSWITSPAIRYHLGVDGLSMWLVVLTGLLAPLGVLISWRAIDTRKKLFYILFLLLQVAMLGIFLGRTDNRRRAGLKYFLYTFISSAILLVGILWVYSQTGTFDVPTLIQSAAAHGISANSTALWLASLAFLGAFAVKVPVFPLHGWLTDAISEAPTAAVMVIAGKLGLYSILRFSFGIFPEQSRHIAPLLLALGAIGIVYGALLALVQTDLKRLAAFATLSAVAFITLGIFSFTVSGIDGGIFHIVSESLTGAAFFMLLGILYERYGSYDIRQYGGVASKLPWMVAMFVIMTLSLVGLPMLNGFVGEFLILAGSMQSAVPHHLAWTVLATSGVILSASYMLWMIQRVFYGDLGQKPETMPACDLNAREHLAMWPLLLLFLVMGVASPFWMRAIDTAGTNLAQQAVQIISPPTAPVDAAKDSNSPTMTSSTLPAPEAK
jgi:NADH-quinone oxidoreductase subunit M